MKEFSVTVTRKFRDWTTSLASWVAHVVEHSPELRHTRVFLPERFTNNLLAPSALHKQSLLK
jgi:hypothetical protein